MDRTKIENALLQGDVSTEKAPIGKFLVDVKAGKKFGFTTGFQSLDKYVGRIDKGQVWAVGGYTGTGKSYFVLNMIDGMLQEPKKTRPKICVFSTELSKQEYILRYIFMKTGVFPLEFYARPDMYYTTAIENSKIFFSTTSSPDYHLKVYGGIYKLEEIVETLTALKDKDELPDVVFIDYVQDISMRNMVREEDSMSVVVPMIKQVAMKFGVAIILVSQVNNYTQQKDFKQGKTPLSPFSNGKKLSHMMHAGIVLSRKRSDSITSSHLQADIVKARAGVSGRLPFEILDGYRIIEIDKKRAMELDTAIENAETPEQATKITKRNDGQFDIGGLLGTSEDKEDRGADTGESDDPFAPVYKHMGYD